MALDLDRSKALDRLDAILSYENVSAGTRMRLVSLVNELTEAP